jgi:hypothetical protein
VSEVLREHCAVDVDKEGWVVRDICDIEVKFSCTENEFKYSVGDHDVVICLCSACLHGFASCLTCVCKGNGVVEAEVAH